MAVNGSSIKIHAVQRVNLALLKSNPYTQAPISCEPIFCKKICNGSYISGDFKKNEALIAAKNGISSTVGSAGSSTRVSIGNSTTFVGRGEISSCRDTNSATTSGPNFGRVVLLLSWVEMVREFRVRVPDGGG